ncbi:MAG: hypothetical protein K2N72_04350, partial [Oscillospiraceae bacterium]|nr:hypothetical protein [Oscillospiraceae bacterium]
FCRLGITEIKNSFGGEEYSTEPRTYSYKSEKCLNEFADRRYEKYIPKNITLKFDIKLAYELQRMAYDSPEKCGEHIIMRFAADMLEFAKDSAIVIAPDDGIVKRILYPENFGEFTENFIKFLNDDDEIGTIFHVKKRINITQTNPKHYPNNKS